MQNQKNIISIVVVLAVVIVGGYFLHKNQKEGESAIVPMVTEYTPSSDTDTPAPATTASVIPTAWDVLQQYLGYLKAHNTEGLKTVVSANILEFNPTCPMRGQGSGMSCTGLMDTAYNEIIKLKKGDFVNSWQDSKQVILFTNVAKQTSTIATRENYGKYYLFFTKSADGTPKFLASYGIVATFVYDETPNLTETEKASRVALYFNDADKDGLLDRSENCVTSKDQVASPYNKNCSTTSPKKRDSLGDGFWDGVRTFFGDPTVKKSQ